MRSKPVAPFSAWLVLGLFGLLLVTAGQPQCGDTANDVTAPSADPVSSFYHDGDPCPDFNAPSSHTILEEDDGCSAWHAPGYENPLANACASCHGPDLTGGFAPSCFTCHGREWDEGDHDGDDHDGDDDDGDDHDGDDDDDDGDDHDGDDDDDDGDDHDGDDDDDDGDDHDGDGDDACPDFNAPPSHTILEEDDGCTALHAPGYENPFANGCTSCHGADLRGGFGPSCFTCHGKEWDDDDYLYRLRNRRDRKS